MKGGWPQCLTNYGSFDALIRVRRGRVFFFFLFFIVALVQCGEGERANYERFKEEPGSKMYHVSEAQII